MKPSLYLVTDLNPLFIRDADVVQPNKKEIVITQIAQLFAEGNVGKRNVTRTGLSRDAHIDTYDMFEKIALRVLKKIDVIHHRAQIEWALGAQFPPEVSAQVDNIIADNTFNAVSIAPEAYRFLEYLKNQ